MPLLRILFALLAFSPTPATDPDIANLAAWLSGDFNTTAQSRRDTTYPDLRLHVRPIWSADTTAIWLYAERSPATTPEQPDQQRIYKLIRPAGAYVLLCQVFLLPEPAARVGAYREPARFDSLHPGQLIAQEGCTMYLEKRNGYYTGGTRGEGCVHTAQSAAYSTALVMVREKQLRIWERGFNQQREQIWGPVTAGYDWAKE